MEVVSVRKLIWTTIEDVEPPPRLWKFCKPRRSLGQPRTRRQLLAVITARATLALKEPFAMQEATMQHPVSAHT
jgi:hypothetical protein